MPDNRITEIEILTEKLLNKTITDEEFNTLEEWYAESSGELPVWQLRDKSREELELRLLNSIRHRIQKPTTTISRLRFRVAAAAAVILVAGTISLLLWRNTKSGDNHRLVVQTSVPGQIRKIYLPDHSIVWLKGNSRLDYPSRFPGDARIVTLHGEALFEVAQEEQHPFVIHAGQYEARVLGTSFNIRENQMAQSFKLTVLTGKVAISSRGSEQEKQGGKPVIVTQGKEFVVGNEQAPLVTDVEAAGKESILYGTEYDMNFENTAFEEVKNRIEKKFNVKVSIGDNSYANCFLSANLTDQSLENTLKIICAALNATYTINKNEIMLRGGGCN